MQLGDPLQRCFTALLSGLLIHLIGAEIKIGIM